MQFITWVDFVLLPFYVFIVYIIAKRFRDLYYPKGHPWRQYFLPALLAKIAGAIFIGLIYQYYYGGGDTSHYYQQSTVLFHSFFDSPIKWFQLVLNIPEYYDGNFIEYTSQMEWYTAPNNYVIIAIAGIFSIVSFNAYLPISVLFAVLSFTGVWAIFRTFSEQYPHLTRHLALVLLFIPSTLIWGSGIFKDTVCLFGLGWMIFGAFTLLIKRKLNALSIIMMVIGFYIVAIVKIYILIAFLPAILTWILFTYSGRIQSKAVRLFLKLAFVGVILLTFQFSADQFNAELGQYSLENIEKTASITQDYIYQTSGDDGSAYSIGELDFSPVGILKSFPLAVNVTLFRPYLWEARKPIVLFNAIEAFMFLIITLKVLFRVGVVKAWFAIKSDANITFCLIFTLIFAFAVGLTSSNFGALSRYRIPCLPFYGLALVLIYYKYHNTESPFISIR